MHNKCQYCPILNSYFWVPNMIIVNQTALGNGEHYRIFDTVHTSAPDTASRCLEVFE